MPGPDREGGAAGAGRGSTSGSPAGGPPPHRTSRRHKLAVAGLLLAAAALAVGSLLGDSITYDETSHLTAGLSYLKTGDFRLAPDHPPLGKVWAAWPLLLVPNHWPPATARGWQIADVFLLGRQWLFELNDGERLIVIPRLMMVLLLVALCATTYALGRRLFGPAAGLLAVALAAFSPTLLAHGRLVTTDVPIGLATALTLLTFARLLECLTLGRFLAAAGALAAASLSKLSWPLVLPALVVMAAVAVLRREPMYVRNPSRDRHDPSRDREGAVPDPSRDHEGRPVARRLERFAVVVILALLLALTTVLAIWTGYGWRASMIGPATADELAAGTAETSRARIGQGLAAKWHTLLHEADGAPRRGLVPAFLRFAADRQLLPDAYLFGLAWTLSTTGSRAAYFLGETGSQGWFWYFPVAFLIKTPIATLLLIAAGLAALLLRRARLRVGDSALLAGLAAYIVIHFAYLLTSHFNIGQRHLLPAYPLLFALAGAAVAWWPARPGRVLIIAAAAWLVGANLYIYPHYLSYFNELIGGPAQGHHYLADSNIDWGQDLKRLARWSRRPGQAVKLSYFGSADPLRYGFPCELLPSSIDTGSVAPLDGGGLYVISVTNLLGVYVDFGRDKDWRDPEIVAAYAHLAGAERRDPEEQRWYDKLRWGRFVYNLRRRPPDERIGYSLFVYRLTAGDIAALTRPAEVTR